MAGQDVTRKGRPAGDKTPPKRGEQEGKTMEEKNKGILKWAYTTAHSPSNSLEREEDLGDLLKQYLPLRGGEEDDWD